LVALFGIGAYRIDLGILVISHPGRKIQHEKNPSSTGRLNIGDMKTKFHFGKALQIDIHLDAVSSMIYIIQELALSGLQKMLKMHRG
jgi:hypothetical protein